MKRKRSSGIFQMTKIPVSRLMRQNCMPFSKPPNCAFMIHIYKASLNKLVPIMRLFTATISEFVLAICIFCSIKTAKRKLSTQKMISRNDAHSQHSIKMLLMMNSGTRGACCKSSFFAYKTPLFSTEIQSSSALYTKLNFPSPIKILLAIFYTAFCECTINQINTFYDFVM